MDKRSLFIKNVNIFKEKETISNGVLLIRDGVIEEIYENPSQIAEMDQLQVIDGNGQNVVPGFIDSHIHGAAGADVMDATKEAIDLMADILPNEGTTSFLATTMTQSIENIDRALENLADYETKENAAEMVGIHLEGPFVNEVKAGA